MFAIAVATKYGFRVPDDISVLGYNNQPEGEWYSPPLTTFNHHVDQITEHLVEFLLNRILNPDLPRQIYHCESELIQRASCAPYKSKMEN